MTSKMSDIPTAPQDLVTGLIHHPDQPPASWEAVPPGVFKASTVIFPDTQALRSRTYTAKTGYTYGLRGTPTTYLLEERLAALEGGKFCILSPSGLAAITNVNLGLLQQGDELLLPANVYGPSNDMAVNVLSRWGITHQFYDPMDPPDLAAKIGPRTKLVWVEAPGSVTMEFPDLPALVAAAKAGGASQGVTVALDNTWGAGLAFRAFDLGIDIVMQALTKYPSGGADVLMGSVVTRDEALHLKMLKLHGQLGIGVAAAALLHWLAVQAPGWAVDAGLWQRPPRGPRRDDADRLQDGMQAVWQTLRDPAEAIGEWTFYALLVLLALALIPRFPYHLFFRTHRLLALAFGALVVHAALLLPSPAPMGMRFTKCMWTGGKPPHPSAPSPAPVKPASRSAIRAA